MSRETDSSSSGPQGRGGAAYPSGTPPYGARPFPSLHPQERPRPAGTPAPDGAPEPAAPDGAGAPGADQPAPDEPRTETTLTTRIRINIPGSRPIPPVVVRTPVEEGTQAPDLASGGPGGPAGADAEATGSTAAPAEPEPEPEKASDWFAPRKAVPPAAPAAPEPGPSFGDRPQPPAAAPSPAPGPDAPAEPFSAPFNGPEDFFRPSPAGPFPDSDTGSGPHPFTPGFPESDTGSGPHPFTPGFPDSDTGSGPHPFPTPDGYPDSDTGSHPFGGLNAFPESDTGSGPHPFPSGFPESDTHSGPRPFPGPDAFPESDTGSTTGAFLPPPVGTGSPAGPGAVGPGQRGPHDTPAAGIPAPFGTEDFPPGVPRPVDPLASPKAPFDAAAAAPFAPPAGPTTGPATGPMPVPPYTPSGPGGPGLTSGLPGPGGPNMTGGPGGPGAAGPGGPNGFRPPAPGGPARPGGPGGPGGPPGERLSGDTLVSGIPAVPPGETRGPLPGQGPAPAPAPERVPAAAGKSKGKGRNKAVLAGAGIGAVLVLAYGAGLLMNHAEVPRGTTVLGVDIGNMTKDAASQKLTKALGNRTTAPLTLTIGGKKQSLKPSVAGLTVDTDATVRAVAHTDYNPVSVIGSLFGGSKAADAVIRVDNDKLKAALQGIAGRNSSGSDGMVRFSNHKAIAVPGTSGTSFDVNAAAAQVAAAYRTRAETGADQAVSLAVTTVPPKVTQAELDKAVHGFGKTAMSGQVVVRADGAHMIPFNNTLPTFLTMVPDAQGKLAPHIDLKVLKSLYGTKFDGVLLQRSNGSKTAVTAQDVATALIQALGSSDPAGRTVTLPHVAK
ncbi:hypothetical protein [Streptomyces sp. NPDC020917]|uniref:hypothetical protein n=1 Tax=Streptomyces sp. NPDC020917 TaxID=3365102 RepID=UPI00379EDB60